MYALLIVTSLCTVTGHILAVHSAERKTPFLSANDRSRWSTIRAIVDHGTYAIDDVIVDRGWDTIDKVRHVGPDGRPHFYSSKPPLLSTLLAGQYWLIETLTGTSLAKHPFYVGRLMLVLTNVLLLVVYFWLLARIIQQHGRTEVGRIFVLVVATWGTYLTSFAVTLNNHLPAAVFALIAVYNAMRIWYDGQRSWYYFALAGFFATLAATHELPALALLASLAVGLLWKAARPTLLAFAPAAALVVAVFLATNYVAHGTLQMPYAQRHVAGGWYDFEGSYWYGDNPRGVDRGEPSRARYALHLLVGHHGVLSLTPVWLISIAGGVLLCRRREDPMPALAVLIGALTLVCLTFYVGRPLADRNYGGVAIGFRWMFWFIPLWLIAMLPAADVLSGHRWGRVLAIVLLAVSVISVSCRPLNPWSHPWIYQYAQALGWIPG